MQFGINILELLALGGWMLRRCEKLVWDQKVIKQIPEEKIHCRLVSTVMMLLAQEIPRLWAAGVGGHVAGMLCSPQSSALPKALAVGLHDREAGDRVGLLFC